MKKLSLLIFLFAICSFTQFAQTIIIKGTVTSAVREEGGMPGVTVQVKGTTLGTITDANGKYTLNVPQDTATLIFSFVGMKKQEVEIDGRTIVDVVIEPDIFGLQEVVITTGYEIKRAPKGTSALTQFVSGDKLNEVRQTNINTALAGKVSGIQFRNQSSVALDRTGSVRLRGDGGFSTGAGILYVADGTILTNSNDLNLDDIENVSVLSGPAASAILGSQGANGAVIITTKKAKISTDKVMGIEVNTGILTSSVYILPNYQNDYAGGGVYDMQEYTWKDGDPVEWKPLDGKYYHNYSDDSSWGPKMAGQEYIPWYSWYPGTKYTGTTARLVPQPDNARDFYDRGWTWNSNIAFSKAGEGYNIRAVIGNIATTGNIPESSLNKTTVALKASYDLTKKLTFGANINFMTTLTNGEFNDSYSNQSTGSFNQWFHRDLDMKIMRELKGLKTPEGIYASWNHLDPSAYDPDNSKPFYAGNYWFNFYTWFDLIKLPARSDRLFGDISLNYKIIEGLTAKVTYRRQQNNGWREEQYSSDLNDSQTQAVGLSPKAKGYYYTFTGYSNRINLESLISFTKKIGDFNINANVGSDFFNSIFRSNSANTVNGLIVKNLYTITNSLDQPYITNNRTEEKYRAIFLRGDAGFKDFLFGEFTLRSDWYSVLPPSNNSILSKSFGGAFVFSDLLKLPFLDFGKIRASWGEIPTAIEIYSYPGLEYSVGLYKWNGNYLMSTPDQQVDPNIHGAVKTQKELGLELRFFKNMVGISATYWDGSEKDIPCPVTIANYSGFATRYLNTGEINKLGLDFALYVKPVSKANLSYELNAVLSYLIKNKIIKIAEGIDSFVALSQLDWIQTPDLVHAAGKPWGEISGSGMKMWEGKPLLNSDGTYVTDQQKYFGSVLPKITGGIQNSLKILKNFTVIANFDFQIGGNFFSMSDMWGTYSGLTSRTSGLNDKGNPIRDPVDEGGGVHVTGVDATTYSDIDYYINASDYFHNLLNSGIYDSFVYDLTYFKLREFSIGYGFPLKRMNGLYKYIKDMNISFVGLNPWLIYSASKDFDPSEISNAGGEQGQLPGTKSFGMNLKVNF